MIAIGGDHGGVDLKEFAVQLLRSQGLEVEDVGTRGTDSVDYPDFGQQVALKVAKGEAERGILICTTGIGMSILANKFPGVRAALVSDPISAQVSRQHNNSNILVLGGQTMDSILAKKIINLWLSTPFDGGRHQRRLDKIAQIERELGICIKGGIKN